MNYAIYENSAIRLYLYEENGKICDISFEDLKKGERYLSEELKYLSENLDAYFNGSLKKFPELSLEVYGTPRERKIYEICASIPYGKTLSYQKLATLAGNSKWSRFVGNTMHKNRLPIVVPCHRVIASGGKIGGFSGGLSKKKWLLDMERSFSEVE